MYLSGRKSRLFLTAFALVVAFAGAYFFFQQPRQPNVILIFTDDWGYGDLELHGALADIKTPHLNALARQGVLFTNGYVTSPQCSPSRAGLLTGRYQQRFGFNHIPDSPLPLEEITLADRLREAGYVTGMVGKWHLEPNHLSKKWASKHNLLKNGHVQVSHEIQLPYLPKARGFDEYFQGEMNNYWRNFPVYVKKPNYQGWTNAGGRFRVDVQTDAGLAFIQRNADRPFFLYLSYFAPHVPLEATDKYLQRFPGEMPERRRTALAMMSAVDDGVGRIVDLLRNKGICEQTLIVFTSDNGAPLGAQQKAPMADVLPVNKAGPAWDGSRNDPMTGEKGMLSEGGIRIPMIWSWPDELPKNKTIHDPMITLDITATILAAAGVSAPPKLDGEDLIPILRGETSYDGERSLFWRFWNQAAVRAGDWKLLQAGDEREMLFNLARDPQEKVNEIENHPDIANQLRQQLETWTDELEPAGLPAKPLNNQEREWYRYYFPTELSGETAAAGDVRLNVNPPGLLVSQFRSGK